MEEERDKLLKNEIKLREKSEKVGERLAFLSEASKILSSSLDYETILASIAGISVPFICDWCAIDLFNENKKLKRVAVVHLDVRKRMMQINFRKYLKISLKNQLMSTKLCVQGNLYFHR